MPKTRSDASRPMVIELKRALDVQSFHVVGDVGFADQRREDLRAIAQLGVESRGRLTPRQLCEQLLGGRPPAVGLRLLDVCVRLGLFEWDGASRGADRVAVLTEEGLEVADGGDVFVPERGTWTLWVTDDPLVPPEERLLRIEPYKEPSADLDLSIRRGGDERDEPRRRRRRPVALPEWVIDACDVQGLPYWGDGRAVSNIELEEKAEPTEADARITLTLRAAPGEPSTVRLQGELAGVSNGRVLSGTSAPPFDELWRACLGHRAADWDGKRLAMRFSELDDDARERFEQTMRFSGLSHQSLGDFRAFEVHGVPIRPAGDADASEWANWHLAHGLHAYLSGAAFELQCESVRRKFAGYHLVFQTRAELARRLRATGGQRPGRDYWRIQAPLDWSL